MTDVPRGRKAEALDDEDDVEMDKDDEEEEEEEDPEVVERSKATEEAEEEDDDDEEEDEDEEDAVDEDGGRQVVSESQRVQAQLDEYYEQQRKKQLRIKKEIYKRLNASQRARYIMFIAGRFKYATVKKVMLPVLGTTKVSEALTIVMVSIAKMFVSDIIEYSLIIMQERDEQGPVRPVHMREAYRRLLALGRLPTEIRRPLGCLLRR